MNIEQQLQQALLEIERLKQENAYLRRKLKQKEIEFKEPIEPAKKLKHSMQILSNIMKCTQEIQSYIMKEEQISTHQIQFTKQL